MNSALLKEPKVVRCAIYTRKSTTEGLDSDFNTLDAQREAAEHFIKSQEWGSCSSAGTVTLASDLVDQDPHFQDFVIAHELLHLRVPTHGRLCKALMSAHVPGWRELEEQRGLGHLNCGRVAS